VTLTKEVQLKRYIPTGLPQISDFKLLQSELPKTLKTNDILVKNLWMSVDPYMRQRMTNNDTYFQPFRLDQALEGQTIGIIEESNHKIYRKGDIVTHSMGWRTHTITSVDKITKLPIKNDENLRHYLSILGKPGLTAYGGFIEIGQPKKSEVVFVSAASGAVGSTVCQLAKIKGCKVVASAGSEEKINWLKKMVNVDVAFNYKQIDNLSAYLKQIIPEGIDLYYENVGGKHLEAALDNMKDHGRMIFCGLVSQYNTKSNAPNNLMQIIYKRLKIQGFTTSDLDYLRPEFYQNMTKWINENKIVFNETIYTGIENTAQAFINMLSGKNIGKTLIKIM
jgi:hypothetical protein